MASAALSERWQPISHMDLPVDLPAISAPEELTPRDALIGDGAAMRNLRRELEEAAKVDCTVLITGETGTGKGVVARAIHRLSQRRRSEFVHMDCGLLSAGLVESEMFGHERGSFTGAVGARAGRFELAAGGSIFLDEIGDMDLAMQRKLLRVLQDREFERVGGTRTIKMTARVIAATNCDLSVAIREGRFRRDLFFRLNVLQIHVPSLRERRSDIPSLFSHFVRTIAAESRVAVPAMPASLFSRIGDYDWPGNVRELHNFAERFVARVHLESPVTSDLASMLDKTASLFPTACDSARLTCPISAEMSDQPDRSAYSAPDQYQPQAHSPSQSSPQSQSQSQSQWQPYREQLIDVLRSTGGNISRAARRLGIPRSTLRYWLGRYSLEEIVERD